MNSYETVSLPDINTEKYKLIFKNIGSQCRSVTRSQRGPIACKISQIIYIIIALFYTFNQSLYENKEGFVIAEKISKIYDMLIANRDIYYFSLLNNPSTMPFEILNPENVYTIFSNESNIFTMGLVNTNNINKDVYPDGVIDHYFIIIKRRNPDVEYSIISSYGSDFVKVPQSEIPLNIDELIEVINAFNNAEFPNRLDIIRTFLYTYFFKDGKVTYFRDEDTFSRPKIFKYSPEEGARMEITHYFEPEKFKFYYFNTFVNVIKEQMEQTPVGGKRKTKSSRKTKRKNGKKRNKQSRKYLRSRSLSSFRYFK